MKHTAPMNVFAWHRAVTALAALVVAVVFSAIVIGDAAVAQTGGSVPGNALGTTADSEFWRQIRQGESGTVAGANEQAGTLIQSEGDNWRAMRNGPLSKWGGWALFGTVALLSIFFVARGRIKIGAGASGKTMTRFNLFERMSHWLLAVSFIILAVSGLNLLYGRYVFLPLIGADAFGAITLYGKLAHNYVAFGFMAGLFLVFLLWIKENIPNRHDLTWLNQGGGMFNDAHPPAKKFNAGQKMVFWIVIVAGVSISVSGWSLLYPFRYEMIAPTFEWFNWMGFNWVPVDLTAHQEMQYTQLWHAIVALLFIAAIIAHIYIGTLGMEGAFDAMSSGEVDTNWAMEHHSLWAEEEMSEASAKEAPASAAE